MRPLPAATSTQGFSVSRKSGAQSLGQLGMDGFFYDEFHPSSAWLRDRAWIKFPPLPPAGEIVVRGTCVPHPDASGCAGLVVSLGDIRSELSPDASGNFTLRIQPPASSATNPPALELRLTGVGFTNCLAWLGRITGLPPLRRFRRQGKNRGLRILAVEFAGETVCDFSRRHSGYAQAFVSRYLSYGINVVGFHTADLGVGESARCMVRAADAAGLPCAVVPLKLNCLNQLGDTTLAARLQDANPHAFNVVHIDPPASRDIDHHHGPDFRAGKYNIGYWAWELPEFPQAWERSSDFFDEIWCPSDFVREAVSMAVPVPVLTMPHAIAFARPEETTAALRARFGLPADRFLFLFLYDLNSYSERKNPQGVVEAFRRSGLAQHGAALVIKTHNAARNEPELAALRAAVADLPNTVLIVETLSRDDIYRLEAACDCFVSLHRSEGFGLAVAESMYLGKPVISTDWSATAEFLNASNGAPVRFSLKTLERSHGPYSAGQVWAEPDLDHAAGWMQRLCTDPALCDRLGAAARATIERDFTPEHIGARYRRRLDAILRH
ncbi:MAG: glycosyltransferase family 4 protein [Opitutaceae bacterium]|nr:glycosyltransferase family 4 protein [Opitutaceae bacterium]